MDKVEPAGKYQVKFVTKEPFAGLLASLGGFWGFIISEAGIKKHGDLNKAAARHGPLHPRGLEGRAAAHPQEASPVLQEGPALRGRGDPEDDPRRGEHRGRAPAPARSSTPSSRTTRTDNKNWNLLKDEKSLTGYRSSRLGYDYLNINASRGQLKDLRVRQAISWAVDRSAVLSVAAAGFGRLTAPATPPMKAWQIPEEQWMRYYKPDVERAKKLMADAGQASGFSVKLSVIPTFPTMVSGRARGGREPQAHRHHRGDRERGVRGVIKRWLAKDFDMTMNTTPGYADPDTAFFRAPCTPPRARTGTAGACRRSTPSWRRGRTMDQKKRKEIYDKVQVLILENVPHLWLFSAETMDFTQASVKGWKQHPTTLCTASRGCGSTRPERPVARWAAISRSACTRWP